MNNPPLICIVGPTATGKSDLAVELALKHNGEIISADSRQVYCGLDIGTGKITTDEMRDIQHHMLDIADPRDTYTVAEYKKDAETCIEDITSRNKHPFLVGGTGFYTQTITDNITPPQVEPNKTFRTSLENTPTEILHETLTKRDLRRATNIDPHDRVRIVRALEIINELGSVPETPPAESPYHLTIIGLDLPDTELHVRINTRLAKRIELGMFEEIKALHKNGLSWDRMETLGLEYRYGSRYVRGLISKEECIETLQIKIRQYAKRQRTWFRRDTRITWFHPKETHEVETFLTKSLATQS